MFVLTEENKCMTTDCVIIFTIYVLTTTFCLN